MPAPTTSLRIPPAASNLLATLLGAFLLFSGAVKLWTFIDFTRQIRAYRLLPEWASGVWEVSLIASGVLAIELVLGLLLLLRVSIRRVTALSILLICGFSALILIGWLGTGIDDCGCFGGLLSMAPEVSLAKNAILLALLAMVLISAPPLSSGPQRLRVAAGLATIASAFALGVGFNASAALSGGDGLIQRSPEPPATRPADPSAIQTTALPATTALPDHTPGPPSASQAMVRGFSIPHDGQTLHLDHGEFFIAVYVATCEHCRESVPTVNALTQQPGMPQVVGLIFGTADELAAFRRAANPQFPIARVSDAEYVRLLGHAPPRFALTRNAAPLAIWDQYQPPAIDAILLALYGG